MTSARPCAVILLITLLIVFSVAFPHDGLDLMVNRTRRHTFCGENAHQDKNLCCLLCPAGKRLVSSCTKDMGIGSCEECDSGTYMDHPNYERKCFSCTKCRQDQDAVTQCTHTQDAVCRCKAGKFCPDDHPCEACLTCTKCGPGEEVARNCTAISDTECKKVSLPQDSNSAVAAVVVLPVLLGIVLAVYFYRRKDGACNSPRNQLKPGQAGQETTPVGVKTEESRALFEVSDSSASSSQLSINAVPFQPCAALPLLARPVARAPPAAVNHEGFPQLTPTNGHESLRKCFEYFVEALNLREYGRFFRQLDLRENVIKSKETLDYPDRMHAMLDIWLENEGRNASLNQLLGVLLRMQQRKTAETIMEKAVENGHYIVEENNI